MVNVELVGLSTSIENCIPPSFSRFVFPHPDCLPRAAPPAVLYLYRGGAPSDEKFDGEAGDSSRIARLIGSDRQRKVSNNKSSYAKQEKGIELCILPVFNVCPVLRMAGVSYFRVLLANYAGTCI